MKNWIRKWLSLPEQAVPVVRLETPESAVVVFRYRPNVCSTDILITWHLLADRLAPVQVVMIPDDTEFHIAIQN